MKALIICISIHHQNTLKIAEVIAEVLEAKIVRPSEIKLEEINNYDLIGFGSGIYFGNYHKSLINLAKNLPTVKDKKAFIFSTSGQPESVFFNLFTKNFKKILEKKGFEILGQFNCRGFDTFGLLKFFGGLHQGRPDKKDLEEAKKFAQNLKLLSRARSEN